MLRRTRGATVVPIVEKGLTGRPAAKQKALEALLLLIELDKPDPVLEELLPILSHKQPKVIAAVLEAIKEIYHAYGCRTVDPKPTLKALPKPYGHADKNVRAQAQNLTVEIYRWLKDSMKPLFWNDLKPVQQTDLDKLFEKVKDEPPPKQERLLRSQQAVQERAAATTGGDDYDEGGEEQAEEEMDLEIAIDVTGKIPKDFQERLASSKWKDRKEALDDLHQAINVPKMEEGSFDDIIRGLAKCMKDANIAVVTIAANCVELFAKGLRKSFSKYRSTIMNPMMERLKEKKQSVADAIGAALDAVFLSTSLGDCLEEILEFLKHKNPQVKLESTKFLIRSLKATREAPEVPQVKLIADASTKLLTESQAVQRDAGAEVLGTLWKIMGDRIMNAHLEGLDEIRKTKIKEFHDAAEVKAKYKPKSAAPPPKAAAPAAKKGPLGKKPALGLKKAAPAPARAASPPLDPEPAAAPLAPKPTSRPGVSKLGAPKSGLARPGGGLGLKKPGLAAPSSSGVASPRRPAPVASPVEEEAPPPAPPKFGAGRGLAGRPLGKPSALQQESAHAPAPVSSGISAIERAELEELRAEVERLRRQNEDMRGERTKLSSQIHELQNQNAQLIEDHTRDVLSIKAKETQLVRARSDAEAAEQLVQTQQREVDRLKRELTRQIRTTSPPPFDISDQIHVDSAVSNVASGRFGDSGYGDGDRRSAGNGALSGLRGRSFRSAEGGMVPNSPGGEGKENFGSLDGLRSKLSPSRTTGGREIGLSRTGSAAGSGADSRSGSALGGRASPADGPGMGRSSSERGAAGITAGGNGSESWKRAAEVTQNLKARIEMMKVTFRLEFACHEDRTITDTLNRHDKCKIVVCEMYSTHHPKHYYGLSPKSRAASHDAQELSSNISCGSAELIWQLRKETALQAHLRAQVLDSVPQRLVGTTTKKQTRWPRCDDVVCREQDTGVDDANAVHDKAAWLRDALEALGLVVGPGLGAVFGAFILGLLVICSLEAMEWITPLRMRK